MKQGKDSASKQFLLFLMKLGVSLLLFFPFCSFFKKIKISFIENLIMTTKDSPELVVSNLSVFGEDNFFLFTFLINHRKFSLFSFSILNIFTLLFIWCDPSCGLKNV